MPFGLNLNGIIQIQTKYSGQVSSMINDFFKTVISDPDYNKIKELLDDERKLHNELMNVK